MAEIAKNNDQAKRPFCGLWPLMSHLKTVATHTADPQTFNEIYAAVEELQRLDDALARLRYERSFVDESDIDQAIDRLRKGA